MKTRCRANSRTWCRAGWRISSICRGPITPWMPPAPPPWRPFSMPAASFRPGKLTSCWLERPIARWTLRPSLNSPPSARSHQHNPVLLTHEPTASSWAKVPACWCSSDSETPFETGTKFSALFEALAALRTGAARASLPQVSGAKFKPLLALTARQGMRLLPSSWWKPMGRQRRLVMQRNCRHCPVCGPVLRAPETWPWARLNPRLGTSRRPLVSPA